MVAQLRARGRSPSDLAPSDVPTPVFVNAGDRLYLASRLQRLRTKPEFALASDDERWVNEIHLDAQMEFADPNWASRLAGYGASLAVDIMIQALTVATHPVQIVFSLEPVEQSDLSSAHATGSVNTHQVRGPTDDLSRSLGAMMQPVMVLTSERPKVDAQAGEFTRDRQGGLDGPDVQSPNLVHRWPGF
jgi:hypothetical protein